MGRHTGRRALQFGGLATIGAALLHGAALCMGPGWIAAMGAPQNIVDSAAQGTMLAPMAISAIGLCLFVVGLCAWSAAGKIRPLPLARPLLCLTAGVLVLRAAAQPVLLAILPTVRAQRTPFEALTAVLCLLLGGAFYLGLRSTATHAAVRA